MVTNAELASKVDDFTKKISALPQEHEGTKNETEKINKSMKYMKVTLERLYDVVLGKNTC